MRALVVFCFRNSVVDSQNPAYTTASASCREGDDGWMDKGPDLQEMTAVEADDGEIFLDLRRVRNFIQADI